MAIIQSIRNRSGWIIGIIGFAIVAFVLGDLLGNNFLFGGSRPDAVGEVNGVKISLQDFERKVKENENTYKINSNVTTIDNATRDLLRDQTWNEYLFETIMHAQYDKLGIGVSPEEMFELVQGSNPHPIVRQAFTNPETGVFDRTQVLSFLKNMDFDPSGDSKQQWLTLEKNILKNRHNEKFHGLIRKGLYITDAQAREDYISKNRTASLELISINYNTVDDTEINLSESDVEAYYESHKNEYKLEPARSIEYVAFNIIPSKEDTDATLKWVNEALVEFKEAKYDSVYVDLAADSPFDNRFHKIGELSPIIDSLIHASDTGFFYGPYIEAGVFKVAKLLKKRNIPDSVQARHILIKPTPEKGLKGAIDKADSLREDILAGKDFGELANTFSEDPGSKEKGGELGWFKPGDMVKPFNDAVFYYNTEGQLAVITSQFGVHLIDVMETGGSSPAVQVAILDRKIYPSTQTEASIYQKVNEFGGKNRTYDAFNTAITENGYVKRSGENIKENDRTLLGLTNARPVVKWAFNAEMGTISNVIELEDKFIIAYLSKIDEEGPAPFEDIKMEMELGAKKEKKAAIIIEKMNNALSGSQYIDEVSEKLDNADIMAVNNISFFNAYVPNVGRELNLVGAIAAAKEGVLSKPVKGDNAVYVFSIETFQPIPENLNLTFSKKQIQTQQQQNIEYAIFEALKKNSDIVDNRAVFY